VLLAAGQFEVFGELRISHSGIVLRGAGAGCCEGGHADPNAAGVPCREIAGRMITHDPDMTRLLDRLEDRGLIVRERAKKDRRMIITRITDVGLELLQRLDEPVMELHDRQLATTFSHACGPPRERGTTWSMFSAVRLQYWQRWPSRANTARRDSGTRLRCGTRTKCTSRITEGAGTTVRSECSSAPLRSTTSAFSFRTRTTARRIETTHSGSKLAFNSSVRPTASSPPSTASAVYRRRPESPRSIRCVRSRARSRRVSARHHSR